MGGWTTYDNAGAQLERSFSDTPVGTILGYGGASAPSGWLLCDGSAVSRTAYAELWGVVGTTYGSGDGSTTFNVPDTTGFIIYAQSISSRVATASPPQYVTSLPSNPVDGQTVVYAADATNGVMWTLRYRAASSSSYKWEVIGGPPMSAYNYDSGALTTSGTAYTVVTITNPSLTLPLAGDYMLRGVGGTFISGATARVDVRLNLVAGSTTAATSYGSHYAQYAYHQHSAAARYTVTSASTVLKAGHSASAASVGIGVYDITIEAMPVRVG